jgi:hypothetical protein
MISVLDQLRAWMDAGEDEHLASRADLHLLRGTGTSWVQVRCKLRHESGTALGASFAAMPQSTRKSHAMRNVI